MPNKFDDLQQSYGRCLREKKFIERFYEIFLDSHPEIRPMFADTDFQKQRMALRRCISAAITHASGSSLSRSTVEQMAHAHSRTGHAPVRPASTPTGWTAWCAQWKRPTPRLRPSWSCAGARA